MADVTVKRFDELESRDGQFLYAGKGLGVTAWSMEPGSLARVGAAQKRKLTPGDDGVTLLAIGGTPPT